MSSKFRWKPATAMGVAGLLLGTINTSAMAANASGQGFLWGDLLQNSLQLVLNIPEVAKEVDLGANKAPFFIPQAKSHAVTTFRDSPIAITLQSRHVIMPNHPQQSENYSIVEGPLHGTLTGSGANLTYTPNPNYTGLDEFTFKVDDGVDGSTTGTIDIKISGSYTAFESGQVRPLTLNSDGTRLYALNTPAGTMEIYDVSGDTPQPLSSVAVGLEPVAIALRNDQEAWVVNTLSDSISIVDLSANNPHVKQTLNVGDEPQDIVFAGANRQRAFITTAHRGQNSPVDFAPLTPGVGRADVWVFDATKVDSGNREPLKIVTMFGMPPRGLAVSPNGKKVYAGIYKSGNQTAIATHNGRLKGEFSTKYGKPAPNDDATGVHAPNTGLIVKYDGTGAWRDSQGLDWGRFIHFTLPDYDVFEIDATARLPKVTRKHAHVGTSLFNLTVNPKTGALYVSNLEARNELRFEGKGERASEQTLRGRFIENRITVIKNGEVLPRDLNTHLVDANPDGSASENARSLAMPLQMQVDTNGEYLYVAAYSSSKVGIFKVDELEKNTFTPSESNHIEVTGGGPSGIVLDESRDRMYVLTRFDNGLSVVDLKDKQEVQHITMHNPEPDFIVEGRPFLYDARFSSGRGDSSCASCHLFGDNDGIAWDLGNPDASWKENPRDYTGRIFTTYALRVHHPLKGPMVTQSLRGLEFQGPQHWRGDRTGAHRENGESLERAAFKEFREAFPGLLGKAEEPTEEELNKFADFVLQLRYPPNPIRRLDDTLTAVEEYGRDTYFNVDTTGFIAPKGGNVAMVKCDTCHELDPNIERFGTNTLMSFEGTETSQDMKIAHLRSVYTKVGMFGQKLRKKTPTYKFMGDQLSGFGYSHDGAADTIRSFLSLNVFHVPADRLDPLIHFLMAYPTGLAPIVGQQVTLSQDDKASHGRIDLMIEQALAHTLANGPTKPKCDLVANGNIDGTNQQWLLTGDGMFAPAKSAASKVSDQQLRALAMAPNNSITFLCAPPGSGVRLALDWDEDGILNGDDNELMGKADTRYTAANPNAEPENDVMIDSDRGGFDREKEQKKRGTYPNFTLF